MRCWSGCASIAAAALAVSALACAPAPRVSAPPRPAGEIALSGVLTIEGADPFERAFVLVSENGMRWRLAPGRFEEELYGLGGHGLRVFCLPARAAPQAGAIAVLRYELLPVDGLVPVEGVIRLRGGGLWLETETAPLVLQGPLAEALGFFDGCRAWVWGARPDRARGPAGGALIVAGYVVSGGAPSAP